MYLVVRQCKKNQTGFSHTEIMSVFFAESYFNKVSLVEAILNLLEESKGDEKWKR